MIHTQQPQNNQDAVAAQLRIYNTASHTIEQFTPIHAGHVGMYVCGATVQSSPHIGHIRAAVAFDVIRRWFERLGYDVTFVRNVTDIDDKILDKAREAGQQWWARAYHYEREFTQAYSTLGVLPPTVEPRATGHVPDMIALVQRLIERGHAYIVPDADGNPSGNVYFDVPSWPRYGELTHQKTGTRAADGSASAAGAAGTVAQAVDEAAAIADSMGPSVDAAGEDKYNPVDAADASEDKHDPRDFALWKAPKDTDPMDARWQTPFGVGRPGWHLECSAMSHRYLGDDFDIHGGGLDLRFPHHENETAQSRAAGWGFAHVWMHSAWVTAKGEKMSKSLGNGLSVPAVLELCGNPWVLRYALGSVQYRSMLEWSGQTISEAKAAYERITNFLDRAEAAGVQVEAEAVHDMAASELPAAFVAAMNEDFNIAGALAAVFAAIRQGNTLLSELDSAKTGAQVSAQATDNADVLSQLAKTVLEIRAMLDALGLDPRSEQWATTSSADTSEHEALDTLVQALLAQRQEARKAKDFATADAIRDNLAQAGITVEDGANGSTWSVTK